MNKKLRNTLFAILTIALLFSFKGHASWLELCSGLAFFLFGMQCMNDGLKQLAGGKLEQILSKSTSTPFKGFLFGVGSTMVLQSTTVVSLLTIAFIGSGLITLAAGITIIIGANLGASSGVWLLALAGQNISLGPFAYPMIVIGILASFNGDRAKALGRVLLGIAFILLAIDLIKNGFSDFTDGLDFTQYNFPGFSGILLFLGIGTMVTVVLQSSHATLMLVLTALGLNQIGIEQAFALAIGAIIGSAVSTGFVGFLGGNRSGMRLAAAHVIFNVVTGIITIILLSPLSWFVITLAEYLSLNTLIQLALFHTLFNLIGVAIFWVLQYKLADYLMIWIPDIKEPDVLISDFDERQSESKKDKERLASRYLSESALSSTETAIVAVYKEIEHLARMSVEVICLALYIPIEQLSSDEIDQSVIENAIQDSEVDAQKLYQRYIKGIYSDLLAFMSQIKLNDDQKNYQNTLVDSQVIALKLADAVKNSKHLQTNLEYYLSEPDSPSRDFYIRLKRHILNNLREIYMLYSDPTLSYADLSVDAIENLIVTTEQFDKQFRQELFMAVRNGDIDRFSTSSLMNDLNYANRIIQSLYNILKLAISSDYIHYNDEMDLTLRDQEQQDIPLEELPS